MIRLIVFLFVFSASLSFADCGPLSIGETAFFTPLDKSPSMEIFASVLLPSPAYASFDDPFSITTGMTGLQAITNSFSCRLQEFVGQMQNTGIFSLVSTINVGSLSGDSYMDFNFGQYGQHTVDFAFDFPSSAFFIIRSVVLCICIFCCITFVVRGA